MNKFLFTTLVLSTALASCAPKKAGNTANSSFNKNNIVLAAFSDVTSSSTLDEAQLKDLPRLINLKEEISAVKNQSDRGTCTFFATAALVESAIKKDLKKEINMSEEYLNYATKNDGYYSSEEGSTVSNNAATINRNGILLEKDWSYEPSWFAKGLPCAKYKNTDKAAPKTCFSHSAPGTIAAAKIIPAKGLTIGSISKDTNEIIKFIAKYKRGLTVDVPVNFNGWPSDGNVYHNETLRQECIADDKNCGGHAILLTGYDMDRKVFFFKNSWGKSWGQDGFGTITFDTIDRYVTSNLYFAKADETLAIPTDFDKDNLALETFQATSLLNDSGINVKVSAKVNNANGRLIYISSFVSSKPKAMVEVASDNNTKVLLVDGDEEQEALGEQTVRALQFYLVTDGSTLNLTNDQSITLNIPKTAVDLTSVASLLTSELDDTLMRTTIYVHTDDQTYKILKRNFLPLAK